MNTRGQVVSLVAGLVLGGLAGMESAAAQDPLLELVDTTLPGGGVCSGLSADGQQLFVAKGASIVTFDIAQVRQWELSQGPIDVDAVTLDTVALEASVTALLHDGQTLFVAGGDHGIFALDAGGVVTPLDLDLGGRWCFDLAIDEHEGLLFAALGARDASELRIYDRRSGALRNTIALDRAHGLSLPGTAFAVALHGGFAYLAMGASGLARVPYMTTAGPLVPLQRTLSLPLPGAVKQGPLFAPPGARTIEELAPYRVRDLAVEGGWLFAAAEASGLVELHLPTLSSWSPATPVGAYPLTGATTSCPTGCATANYPIRVETLTDVQTGMLLALVGASHRPSAAHEWGPYYQYSTLTWRLGPPGVDESLYPSGCFTSLAVFERPDDTGATLDQALFGTAGGQSAGVSWKSLCVQFADGHFWMFDNEFTVWNFERVGGSLQNLNQSPYKKYHPVDPSFSSGVRSLLDPHLILAGSDAALGPSLMYRVEGPEDQPTLELVPGSDDESFTERFGLLMRGQWLSPLSGLEWVAYTGPQGWNVTEVFTSPGDPGQVAQPGNLSSWSLAFPEDPQMPGSGIFGRSYSSTEVDLRTTSRVIAMSRTGVATPVVLYDRMQIESAAAAAMPDSVLHVPPLASLAPHPELLAPLQPEFVVKLHALYLRYASLPDVGAGEHTVLGVAAGYVGEPTSPYFEHPKIAFFDVSDCQRAGDPCSAAFDPGLGGPVDPTKTALAYGSAPLAITTDLAFATLEGVAYAFACDTSGTVLAFDLTNLFPSDGSPRFEVARWSLAPSPLDGFVAPLTGIAFREEPTPTPRPCRCELARTEPVAGGRAVQGRDWSA